MSSGELVDFSVSVYQELGAIILKYTAVPTLISLAAVAFLTGYVLPSFGLTNHPNDVPAQVGEAISLVGIAILVGAPLFAIGVGFSSAFVTGLVGDYMNGEAPAPELRLKRARETLRKVIALAVWQLLTAFIGLVISALLFMASAFISSQGDTNGLAGLTSLFGILAFVVGAITCPIILGAQILAVPIVVLEGLKPLAAVRRCRALMKGSRINPSGYNTSVSITFLVGLLVLFVYGGIHLLFGLFNLDGILSSTLAGSAWHDILIQLYDCIPWFLTLWTVIPVWCTSSTILYFERRTRIEGYDIEALARDLRRHERQNRFQL